MRRVCEPEVMDDAEDAHVYDAMHHEEVNARVVDDLLRALNSSGAGLPGEGLDLGTGTARIPLLLARHRPDLRMVAVDLSARMLELAGQHVARAGLGQQIYLQQVDAKRLPYADQRFAVVFSNSLVHHLAQPADAISEAVRVARPGGLLFFRDLFRPADDGALDLLVATYSCDEPPLARSLFRDSLRAALTLDEMRQLVEEYGFSADTVQQTSDRHWTWLAQLAGEVGGGG